MANPPANRKLKDQLNVRVPEELLDRVTKVAEARDQTLAEFVIETLDERTKDHKADVSAMAQHRKNIAEREKKEPKR